ncbi:hypothetical protein K3X13_11165 [Aliiroseovarius crassostreae]|uniref:hypothetical protein n=1 Tax=Aliiroseovarius crassostreae TaxID=154981 RepID=UPI0022088E26|nr:hypothetical protein [Aliiroseovarius crassostreae]UWP91613.1 hypothetical protein K3X13_11165 [Aliiroseovarius crassostreae]
MSAFQTYWKVYGGWQALFLSPYFLLSGVFWAFCKPIWFDLFDAKKARYEWIEWAISVLPSMVSFSLGALAIFLAFSNKTFLSLIREGGEETSYLMQVTVALFHFIVVQFVALGLVFLCIAYPYPFFSGVGYWAFIYAISCGIAAAAALVDTAEILNAAGSIEDDDL